MKDTIKINKDTSLMLGIIKQCDELDDSLNLMVESFNMADKYKDEMENRMQKRVAKIRNEVLEHLGFSIRNNFLESEHTTI